MEELCVGAKLALEVDPDILAANFIEQCSSSLAFIICVNICFCASTTSSCVLPNLRFGGVALDVEEEIVAGGLK